MRSIYLRLVAEHSTEVRLDRRLIVTRMTGLFTVAEMNEWAQDYRDATDRMRGRMHMVIADMRGMKTLRKDVAEALGEAIGYGRQNGCVLCAHLSDDTVQRLQAQRLARQNSVEDDRTVDVASLQEAYQVCAEGLQRIDDAAPLASIRR